LSDQILTSTDKGITYNPDGLSETMFHELTHAAYFSKVGSSTYGNLVSAEIDEIINGSPKPYGSGNDVNAPIIALGESWAYHIGHYFANFKYQTSTDVYYVEQGTTYKNGTWGINLACHLNLLEDFNPQLLTDPFHWIPQGLYYDLKDPRNDKTTTPFRIFLDDQCSGYSNKNFFDALDADIVSLQAYKTRLLNENNNSQAPAVNTIFNFYGY
jgi:hypothetical protein